MTDDLPEDARGLLDADWSQFEPHYEDLLESALGDGSADRFLRRWSRLTELVGELGQRLYVAKTVNIADDGAQAAYARYLEQIFPPSRRMEQALKQKLIESEVAPLAFEVPLRRMRADAELFRDENVLLLAEERKLESQYDEIRGAATIIWEGQELPLPRVAPLYELPDRQTREKAWRLASTRELQDRQAINELWKRFLALRLQIAGNAGLPDYREYKWRQLHRFDYGPEDSLRFHEAVKEVVVPAVTRRFEQRRQELGVRSIRPWDTQVDPLSRPPLHPFVTANELTAGVSRMIHAVDPQLGRYFDSMVDASLLDLDSRKNKAPGGYCTTFAAAKQPFIFMNAAGVQRDVETLLHESGHAFHVFETQWLPYFQQRMVGSEFAEVASMSMELIAAPNLVASRGGFYSEQDGARARLDHLEGILRLWPRLCMTDAFQHWVYTHPDEAGDSDRCDARWAALQSEYTPYVDWSGLEEDLATGWHRILHIHTVPFYIIEYAMAQFAAVSLWRQTRRDQGAAVERYRAALALGATRPLPELFAAVDTPFEFTASTLRPAVEAIEETIAELEPIAHG